MKFFIVVVIVITFISSCSFTKNWQGTSTDDVTRAKFVGFNGKQNFTISVPNNNTYLIYKFERIIGNLSISIKSQKETLYNKGITNYEADSVKLINQKGQKYKVSVKGKKASGSFDIHFQ